MKYPDIREFNACADLSEFDCIIDVRSPAEFAEDHIPGAINCPVLDNAERIRVGTLYKQVNAFEAKKVGAALVAINIGRHLATLFQDKPREWKPLIYCWRGGNRSGAMAHIFAKVGWPVVQLDGGYKAYRRHVVQSFTELAPHLAWRVVCGTTGSGKSRLLQNIAAQGGQVLDLEQLAQHRGSLLGTMPSQAQPSQKLFESRVWQILREFDSERPVFVEAESKKIGNLSVPDPIMEAMRQAACINLQLDLPERVALLLEDYAHFVSAPEQLVPRLEFLTTLHGKEKISQWKTWALTGELGQLVHALLVQHYDPAYLRSISRNFVQIEQALEVQQHGIATADFAHTAQCLLQGK
jgi:tRNA 2-selenouridine synthase